MKAFFFLVLLASSPLLLSCDSDDAPPVDPAKTALLELSGTYADPEPYAYGQAFGHRTFTFDEGHWTLDFTLGLDPALQLKVFSFRTHGRYDVGAASTEVAGAYEAVFGEDAKYLTLHTDDPNLIDAFGLGACGLRLNVEADISTDGCSAWASVADCPEDHDLLMLDEAGGLHFGVRPPDNNMCTGDRRPTALTSAVHKQ